MNRASMVLTSLAAALAVALPAAATDYVPITPNVKNFFHCSSAQTSKVGNLDAAAATWNTTAPAASVQAGAGCGQADTSNLSFTGLGARVADARFAGTYTGNLDQLNVRLDAIYVGQTRTGGAASVSVILKVDGVDLLGESGTRVNVTPVPSSTRASEMFEFSVNGIGLLKEEDYGTHDVELYVKAPSSAVEAWVYDTTEVPGGIEFSPTALKPAVLAAQRAD